MLLSKSCRYALRASIYLANEPDGKLVGTKIMCSELNICFHYLVKIMQRMNKHNLIHSERGTKGGVRLARPAKQIFVSEIIHAIEGEDFFTKCVLGFPTCGKPTECALHKEWESVKTDLNLFFNETSLHKFSKNNRINHKHPEILNSVFLQK